MDSDDIPVMEGFICPICKSDRGTADNLLSHFQDEHSEEQDLIKTFRDLLDKAKKKILKQEVTFNDGFHSRKPSSNSFEYVYEPQEIGSTFSHKKWFFNIREERLQRLAVPTNQLVIRLEKLLDGMPGDPLKRKAHEQSVVPWVDGTAVPRCPNCAGSFHLARRQHHCRTCGSVMCNDCSHYVSLATAKRILDKPSSDSYKPQEELRVCIHCITILEMREEKRENKKTKPIITQFYERLAEYRSQADSLTAEYSKIASSLNAGESTYHLKEAQVLKVKLSKLAENIDNLSSKIAVLGRGTDTPPEGMPLKLQTMVRAASTAYLRNNVLSLAPLPTEEQLVILQQKRRQEITARIHEEKLRQEARTNPGQRRSSPHRPDSSSSADSHSAPLPPSLGQGWVPSERSKKGNDTDDPIIEQMNIIRGYIKEAKLAHKYDEVSSLEENLQELKKEFWRKQQAQDELASRSGESSEAASLSSFDDVRTLSESIPGDSSH